MSKLRVFELAKELNTTSKRLMEKLEEINVKVKSHMSLLEDDELDRLYKHIGVVNRNRVEGSGNGDIVDQQEQPDNHIVRKSIPRIIRKTEIIIHDDEYEHDNKEKEKKKNKRNFVRSSSSTDGLMAGLQRGNDNHPSSIRKHASDDRSHVKEREHSVPKKRAEEVKGVPETGENDIVGINQRGERIKRPVDSILSIKKVSSRDDWEKHTVSNELPVKGTNELENDEATIKDTDNGQGEKTETVTKTEEAETNQNIAGIQKETVSAKAENTEERMAQESQKVHETEFKKSKEGKPEGLVQKPENQISEKKDIRGKSLEEQNTPINSKNMPINRKDRKEFYKERTGVSDENKRESSRDSDKGRRSTPPEQRQFRERDGRDRGMGQNRGTQQKPVLRNNEERNINRTGGAERSYNRSGSDRGYNQDSGGENRGQNRDGGMNRSFNRDGTGNRVFNRDAGQGRDFQKTGDFKYSRDNGDNRGFIRSKEDQGRSFDRNRDQGFRGRNDDRARVGNKPLVIPKANIAPGQVEEKNNLRGERRSSTTRDLEKGFKREAKKEQPKKDILKTPVSTVVDKNKDKYRKNFVVGHTASVSDMYSDDFVLNEFYEEKDKLRKDRKGRREEKHIPPKAVLQEITISETITVKNLSEALKKSSGEVIKKLMAMGIMATLNQELDFDTAAIIGDEYKVRVKKEIVISDEDILFDEAEDNEEELVTRAPVVVVMGHVDHGKTSLLDAIRKTNVADNEAGGITQHIGAYKVKIHDRDITFLDTPGHEAFTAMRARGAQATDIAILVVAADDGVMPQTIEAINHAKAANVSIIVAINKIDKHNANPDRVKQELADRGVLIEEWGGDVIAVPVSATKGDNIDHLLEMVILTADILELKSNPDKQAKGIIIEAQLDKGRGPVATLLVQRGTLHSGDSIISGITFGRIRAMTNDKGKKIDDAGPSTPVEVIGLDEVPEAGDVFYAVSDEKVAKHLVDKRKSEHREQSIGVTKRVTLDDLFQQIQHGEVKELNIIVKADVQGSVEAVRQSIEKLSNDEVKVQIIHGGVGAINEADVTLASVSNAIIIGFNVRPPANVIEAAEAAGVDMRLYRIIYNAIEDIEKAMKGMLAPTYREVIDGHIEIRQTFKASNVGTIGGGYVTDGKVQRSSDVRVVRNGIVVYEGKLGSLKRFKDDVKEVAQGYECGILVERFNDIKEGDVIEAFRMEEVERT